MIALLAATERGRAHAEHLVRALDGAELIGGRPRDAIRRAFEEADAIVCFVAVGVAVRLIAPLLKDKRSDPGVVVVDDAARFAIALCGGHEGGANGLAERVARALGCTPVITTASEQLGIPPLHELGAELGFRLDPQSDLAAVGAALLDGRPVRLVSDRRWPIAPLPPNVVSGGDPAATESEPFAPAIVISDRLHACRPRCALYRPPSLVVGVGAASGADAAEILALIDDVLEEGGVCAQSVASIASIEAKAEEPGLVQAARQRGWPLRLVSAEALAEVPVPNPSVAVANAVGTPSVAEAAAIAVAAAPVRVRELAQPPELLVAKRKSRMATAALARRPVRGRLALVGLGPGEHRLLPQMAADALAAAQIVVGYELYLEQVQGLLRPGSRVVGYALGEELERCRFAIAEASMGASVALLSSGDAGIYGMASPALSGGGLESVDVVCIPGITAANAVASLVGAPLGHDHCAISLSDLLTPWEVILERVRAAARADFVISFYNPRSRRRDWQLEAARALLLEHRPAQTPVALVTDAYRPGQRIDISTLARFDCGGVGMTTVVMVGSSQTRMSGGRMVTPRGYPTAPPPHTLGYFEQESST